MPIPAEIHHGPESRAISWVAPTTDGIQYTTLFIDRYLCSGLTVLLVPLLLDGRAVYIHGTRTVLSMYGSILPVTLLHDVKTLLLFGRRLSSAIKHLTKKIRYILGLLQYSINYETCLIG